MESALGQGEKGSAKPFVTEEVGKLSLNLTQLWIELSQPMNCLLAGPV